MRALLFAATLLAFCSSLPALAQEPSTAPAHGEKGEVKSEVKSEIYSGTVTELSADAVSVSRKLPGKDPEIRKFLLNAQTRVEGKLRTNARVTVRFEGPPAGGEAATEEPVLALHIIVR